MGATSATGEIPQVEAPPARLPDKTPSPVKPVLALPVPPAAHAAAAPSATTPVAGKPATAAVPAQSGKAGASTPPKTAAATAPASLPATVPSTVPVVDPKAERLPDIARSIAVELGARIEIPFEGTGWTYLGERDGKEGILYESRRYEAPGLVFVLNPVRQGDFILRFQKQDLMRGTTNEELVAVKVGPKAPAPASGTAAGHGGDTTEAIGGQTPTAPTVLVPSASTSAGSGITAPLASPPVSSSSGAGGGSSMATAGPQPGVAGTGTVGTKTVPAAQAVSPSAFASGLPTAPASLVAAARGELSAGRIQNCLAVLDRYMDLHPEGMDEVFFLYGVALEQNGPTKDVKRAYAYYKRIRDDYPQSQLWDQASERMSYIERHYFSIR